MSMIGNAFLTEIINEKGIVTPAEILNQLRDKVISSLKQEHDEGHNTDGMDISLLCIDDKNNTVEFAGANNPFWYVHKGILTEIKGDKQPIGKHDNAVPFTTHTLTVTSPASFYLFSDGYADQFSEDDNKMMSKRFKEVLSAIQNKAMAEQEKHLAEYFEKWKGHTEQTDDVLVIGIKL